MKKIIPALITAALIIQTGGISVYAEEENGEAVSVQAAEEAENAGTYTTFNVVSYLNIRSAPDVSAAVLGTIPAGESFVVSGVSGGWALAVYNGTEGYVSADYIRMLGADDSSVSIENAAYPQWFIPEETGYSLSGVITSRLALSKVSGGVYTREGEEVLYAETFPDVFVFDAGDFLNDGIDISTLPAGEYTYRLYAEDQAGSGFQLADSDFTMLGSSSDHSGDLMGDMNGDGAITAADLVILEKYLLGAAELTVRQYIIADMTYDMHADTYDLVLLRQRVVSSGEPVRISGTYTTKGVDDYLNIRKEASVSSEVLGTIPAGAVFTVTDISGGWAAVEYNGIKGYASADYIQEYSAGQGGTSVLLNVMEFNQHPDYPTGCESAALYMLLRYYGVNVTMEQIVSELPKGPLPYAQNGTLYGANPEREFVGDPHSGYSYGVFNVPIAQTAAKFRSGVKTKTGAELSEVIDLLDSGSPVVAWYTTNPDRGIYYTNSWYDYQTGALIRWPSGEHAVVVCGHTSEYITYRDPNTGSSKTMKQSVFQEIFDELGGRIVYYEN